MDRGDVPRGERGGPRREDPGRERRKRQRPAVVNAAAAAARLTPQASWTLDHNPGAPLRRTSSSLAYDGSGRRRPRLRQRYQYLGALTGGEARCRRAGAGGPSGSLVRGPALRQSRQPPCVGGRGVLSFLAGRRGRGDPTAEGPTRVETAGVRRGRRRPCAGLGGAARRAGAPALSGGTTRATEARRRRRVAHPSATR